MSEWERIREANRIRREQEAADKETAQRELASNATVETLRHRQAAVLDEMMNREVLTAEQHQAGMEIARVWMVITSGLFVKVQDYQPTIRGAASPDWQAGLITAYQDRYIPWRNEVGRIAVRENTLADLTFRVVIDNYGPYQIARMWRMDANRVKMLVRQSLHHYAKIGGWVDHCGRSVQSA